jgi:hypothetical protein
MSFHDVHQADGSDDYVCEDVRGSPGVRLATPEKADDGAGMSGMWDR